jgi:hypothetical protein
MEGKGEKGVDAVGIWEGELKKRGKRNGWSSVERRIRERDEANFIQDKGKENERNLRQELMEGKGEKGVGDWMEWDIGKEN